MIKNYKVMPLGIKIDEKASASDVAKKLHVYQC
jgi:hypothetical protein